MLIKENLKKELTQATKPVIQKLQVCSNGKLILILFKKGMVLAKHKTSIPAQLLVLKGVVKYVQDGKEEVLSELDTKIIPLEVYHEVVALEESHCLLIQVIENNK